VPGSSARAHGIGERSAHDRFDGAASDRRLTREPIGFHVTIRLEDDRPIATSAAARRVVARVVLEQGEARGLLAFGAADDHLHAALATDRASAGAFARYVESALVWQLGLAARFERARIRPLLDQRHAYNTFRYTHRQDSRHLLDLDLAREGTSLPDLLGMRVLGTSLLARVRAHLPRIRRADLVGEFPAGVFEVAAPLELDVLTEAAAAALALPDLRGLSPDAHRARRAAVHAAGPDVPTRRLGESLGLGMRAVQSLRKQEREPLLIGAVARQAHLRTATAQILDASWSAIR
jgi:hypothetical protein